MLPILIEPDPQLRQRSTELTTEALSSVEHQTLINEMIPTMYEDDGIGLAAPQVGRNVRIVVIGKEALSDMEPLAGELNPALDLPLINPVWERTSKKQRWAVEGCLSVPKTFGKVKRYIDVRVSGLDRHGAPIAFHAKNYLARVIQHEVDHLDGVLFVDKAKGIYTT